MLTPLGAEIKEKVISAYLSGKGRNQIDRELREQGTKISHGSISNIINAFKKSQKGPIPISSQPITAISTSNDINVGGDSDLGAGLVSDNQQDEQIDFSDNPEIAEIILENAPYNEKWDGENGQAVLGYNIAEEDVTYQHNDEQVSDIHPTTYNYQSRNIFLRLNKLRKIYRIPNMNPLLKLKKKTKPQMIKLGLK